MSNHSIIHLLVVDRSLSDSEHIARLLRGAGHAVHVFHADQQKPIRGIIDGKPLDLILMRPDPQLPSIAEVQAWVSETARDIPILAIVDEQSRETPAGLLSAGAENLLYLDVPEQVVRVTQMELGHLQIRRRARRDEARLKEAEQRFRVLLDSSRDAIAYIHEGVHIYANPVYLKLFGYASEEELEAVTLMNLVVPEDRGTLKGLLRRYDKENSAAVEPVKLTGLRSDGTPIPVQLECLPARIDDQPCLQITVRDAASPAALQEQLDELGRRDALTGLYNRKFFSHYLEQCRTHQTGAVLYILLTEYRATSERLGLEAVDQLVIDTASLLQGLVAPDHIIARFSDATFTVFTPESSRQAVLALGEKLRKAIKAHTSHAAQKLITTTCCIGIRLVDEGEYNASQLLSEADRACETARQMGGDQVQLYRPLTGSGETRHDEEQQGLIQAALAEERLTLLYQPIASLRNDAGERYKIHVGLLDEDRKPLSLRNLAPVAERHGLLGTLDKWVIARSMEACAARPQAAQPATLFIRISRNSITDGSFGDWLDTALNNSGIPAAALVLEIDEESAEHYFKETRQLRERLRGIGCGLALSHFGGKANSERMAQHLRPDYVKLDSTLIDKLAASAAGRQTMTTLIDQLRTMAIRVVAEQVSSAPQLAAIWQFGITLVQGSVVQERSPLMNFDFQQFAG